MWVEVAVDGGERFPAMVDRLESALLPLASASQESKRIEVWWPGYAEPFRRLLVEPEPSGAGLVRFRLERDGTQRSLDY